MKLLKLKIGRHTYNITDKDEFMFDGCHTWLVSQSKERLDLTIRPDPRLSKRAIKEISLFKRIQLSKNYFKLEKFP